VGNAEKEEWARWERQVGVSDAAKRMECNGRRMRGRNVVDFVVDELDGVVDVFNRDVATFPPLLMGGISQERV